MEGVGCINNGCLFLSAPLRSEAAVNSYGPSLQYLEDRALSTHPAPASCVQAVPGAQLTAMSLRGKGQAPITVLRAEMDQN